MEGEKEEKKEKERERDVLTNPGTNGLGKVHHILTVVNENGLDGSVQKPHSQWTLLLPVLQNILGGCGQITRPRPLPPDCLTPDLRW